MASKKPAPKAPAIKPATRAERDRVRRIREKMRDPRRAATLTSDDKAFEASYSKMREGRGRPRVLGVEPPEQAAPPARGLEPNGARAASANAPEPHHFEPAAPTHHTPAARQVPLEQWSPSAPLARVEGAPAGEPEPYVDASCPVKAKYGRCVECERVEGAMRCGTTSNPVYEPIDDDAAEAFGAIIFGVVGFGARFLRPDHAVVRPTDREVERMNNAVKKVAHRRANALGAIDDVVMLTFATTRYAGRAYTAPGDPKLPGGE